MNPSLKTDTSIRESLLLLFLFVIVFFLYSNSFTGPFIFDARHNVYENPHIRITNITFDSLKRAGFESPSSNRPVANISFALNYYFHQYNVFGYHLVNMLIHIAAGILLYFFTKTTLEITAPKASLNGSQRWISFFTALVWLVHPVQTQSVTYIVQRMNSLAAMFYVLAFLLYARFRLAEKKWQKTALAGGCFFAGALAVGSKETAVTLPFFIFLYEWYFFRNLSWSWLKRHLGFFVGVLMLLFFFTYLYLGKHPIDSILSGYESRDFTLPQRLMTEFRVVIFYISLLIFPHPSRLNLDHDFSLSLSLLNPASTLFSMILIAGLFVMALHLARRHRLTSFCILWFLGNLLIESSVIGLEIIFEHRLYLPSMCVCLMAVAFAHKHIKPKWLMTSVLCFVVALYSLWTYERNSVWRNAIALYSDCVKKSPNKARPHNNLGFALDKQGRIQEAIQQYLQALRIKPDYKDAHYNLGVALDKQGRTREAMGHYLQALRIKPDFAKAINNLGNALDKLGRTDKAIVYYLQALQLNPDSVEAHNNLGVALDKLGRTQEAVEVLSQALRIKPDSAVAHNNLGVALFRKGDINAAVDHFREALRLKPDYAPARINLNRVPKTRQKDR